MKRFKTYINEERERQNTTNAIFEHFINEDYGSNGQMSLSDRLDLLNDEIEGLEANIAQTDNVVEMMYSLAEMVNKARFYTALTVVGSSSD